MGVQEKNNEVDLALVKENLSLTVEERLKKHADALNLLETLEAFRHTLSHEQ